MKFLVGYQTRPDEKFDNCILSKASQISEVYFSWGDMPNGRNSTAGKYGILPWEAAERQRKALKAFSEAGIGLNLLLNGNCYGSDSLSKKMYQTIGDLVDYLNLTYGCGSVTTASPVIAHFVKTNFEDIEVRASVNMAIGRKEAVDMLQEDFDGFYLQRELNRDIEAFASLSEYCRNKGKKVYMLANSGCLNYCPARNFHDNLVAHENEMMKVDNAFDFHGICRDFLTKTGKERLLEVSNWVRPEDIYRFEEYVDGVKLATRVHSHPEMIVLAYLNGRYSGNLLNLTEPDYSSLYHPYVLNNSSIPEDFFEKRSGCAKNCDKCGYCRSVMNTSLEQLENYILFENEQN